jgi:hypothetical protein
MDRVDGRMRTEKHKAAQKHLKTTKMGNKGAVTAWIGFSVMASI